jgi:UDP-N-acetylmuramate--alanine ligase
MENKLKSANHYFFIGIAGTGMSAIAQYLKGMGKEITGSDRLFESSNIILQQQFEKLGITCFKQDGSGMHSGVDIVVVSTAIEESNPEYKKALELNIPVVKRSEVLAYLTSTRKTIAIGGSSGKSTTAAMVFHILSERGKDPSLITGAGLIDLQEKGLPGNAWVGKGDWLVIEADESDGSIVNYFPETGVILNIDRDHKEFKELIPLFTSFRNQTKGNFIVNYGNQHARKLSVDKQLDFGIHEDVGIRGKQFKQSGYNISFLVNNIHCNIPVAGKFNMENALAALAASLTTGIKLNEAVESLKSYRGIYRRMQVIGEKNGVVFIDDFAHNPVEVSAAIASCQLIGERVIAWFQPHGYGPLRFMQPDLIEMVANVLGKEDIFIMSDIYYAGGTVARDIHSRDIINSLRESNTNVIYLDQREKLKGFITENTLPGDVVLLMGARDPSLAGFAKELFQSFKAFA